MHLTSQKGESSVTTIVLVLFLIGIMIKLGIAIVPDQVGDYQLKKLISNELAQANAARAPESEFLRRLDTQMTINANYNIPLKEMMRITNKTPGQIKVHVNYEKESQFMGNVFVVNRFEYTLTGAPDE